jgi:hypothetical protein
MNAQINPFIRNIPGFPKLLNAARTNAPIDLMKSRISIASIAGESRPYAQNSVESESILHKEICKIFQAFFRGIIDQIVTIEKRFMQIFIV